VVHYFVILLTDVVKTWKNHTTVTDLKCINLVNLFYSFIFQQSLFKFVDYSQLYGELPGSLIYAFMARNTVIFFGRDFSLISCI